MRMFNLDGVRMAGSSSHRPVLARGKAEAYARSLGLAPGGPGWGDAIRDYILNGDYITEESAPPEPPSRNAQVEDDRYPVQSEPPRVRSVPNAFRDEYQQGTRLAQLPPETPAGRYMISEMMGPPRHGFEEDDPKPPVQGPLRPPAVVPGRKGPLGGRDPNALQKRYFLNSPRWNDSGPLEDRIVEAVKRLPAERRDISRRFRAPITSSPQTERYYSTILAREDGVTKEGAFKTNHLGMVGPAQMKPSTAQDAARFAGIPLDRTLFRGNRAYNEVLGLALLSGADAPVWR